MVAKRLNKTVQSIGVFRALRLGDMLCATPALRALRHNFPQARITLIGLPWAADFARRLSFYTDDFIAFPGFPGLPEQEFSAGAFTDFLRRAQGQCFDLLLQLHGDGSISNLLMELIGARQIAGFSCRHGYQAASQLSVNYSPSLHSLHAIHKSLYLLGELGLQTYGEQLEFPVYDGDRRQVAGLPFHKYLAGKHYICLHPGARCRNRRWPPQLFAKVGDYFAAQGCLVVLTGSHTELDLTQQVKACMRHSDNVIDTASCDLPLGMLGALLEGAQLLVTNDTGVSHLAVALSTLSVTVFLKPHLVGQWAPLDRRRHKVAFRSRGRVPSDEVIAAAKALYAPSALRAAG